MVQLYQDAMAVVRKFGKPDLFITFTCNPEWPEIQVELLEFDGNPAKKQAARSRPDLVSCVFKLKLAEFLGDIKNGMLGTVIVMIYVIEFQKRGLPHAHFLLILDAASKMETPEEYDSMVSAEFPDPETHLEAYRTVTRCMVHEPCGEANLHAPCMVDGRCSKKYLRAFNNATHADDKGYPVYRRREVRRVDGVSNQWVVLHNLWLASKYNAHINVEVSRNYLIPTYLRWLPLLEVCPYAYLFFPF